MLLPRQNLAQLDATPSSDLSELSQLRNALLEAESALNREREENRLVRVEHERASRSKDIFLAALSHELRTPLSTILAWAQMLKSGRLDADKTRTGIEMIEKSAKAQARLINDLLDISRITNGKIQLEPREVDLAAIIRDAIESVAPALEAKGLKVELALEQTERRVLGDPARLQQVLWNLVSNAMKFTPAGGRITIALSYTKDRATIVVTDSGIGISSDFLPCIFDEFSQADCASSRKTGGLGLGLAIVRQLVQLHGGTVSAHSDGPGMGATFGVTLPLVNS